MLPELLTDADAVVPDVEFIVRIPLRRGGLLHDPQADHTAGGREFHGVGQDVQQDLVEPHGVGNDLLIHNIDGIDEQGQPLGNDVRLNDVPDVMHQIRQIHRLCLQGDPAAFNAAHIQHIVDEGQQMLAGGGDLFQVINDLIPVVNMGGRQRGEADDGVHRCADIVGHIEQELPLGAVRRRLVADSKLQLGILLLQRFLISLLGLLLPELEFPDGAPAEPQDQHHDQDICSQRRRQVRRGGAVDLPGGNVCIKIVIPPVAIHAVVLPHTVSDVHKCQLFRLITLSDRLDQPVVGNVLSDELRVIGRLHPAPLYHKEGRHGVGVIAVQQSLDGQNGLLGKGRQRMAVGQHRAGVIGAAMYSDIGIGAVLQIYPLHIGLLGIADDVKDRRPFQVGPEPGVADAVLRVLAHHVPLLIQYGNSCKPQLVGIHLQLRLAAVQRDLLQRPNDGTAPHQAFGDGNIVVVHIAVRLILDKFDCGRQPFLAPADIHLVGEGVHHAQSNDPHRKTGIPEPCAEHALCFFTAQGSLPPDRFRGAPDICRGSPAECRPAASGQRSPSAFGPAHGYHCWKRRRRSR